ncbi:MAG: DUF308 domain-containing protein [Bacteroidales bacterium]|nr:DUF308 domain-containing protein [Bacteroidales bacterium]
MILFGYKTKFSSILRALSAIGIGLVMLLRTDASVVVVRIIAVLLVVAGIVSFIHGYVKRKEGALPLMSVNAGVDILLGLVLFFWPGAVAGFIIAAIGVVLIIFGILQFVVMSGTVSLLGAGFLPLCLSALAVIGGVTLLMNPWENTVMSRLAGIALIYYGITELLSTHRMVKAKEAYEIQFAEKKEAQQPTSAPTDYLETATDVSYEKVEDEADAQDSGVWVRDEEPGA